MTYLDTSQLVRPAGPGRAPGLEPRQAALVGLVTETLALHRGNWTVATALSLAEIGGAAHERATRLAIMGDPARHADVAWTGTAPGYDPNAEAFVFTVTLYYGTGWGRTDGPQTAAEVDAKAAAFRAVAEGEGVWDGSAWTVPPGVLWALRRQDAVTSAAGDEFALGRPSDVAVRYNVRPDEKNPDDLHEVTFSITLA
jgi:hypothetical protein